MAYQGSDDPRIQTGFALWERCPSGSDYSKPCFVWKTFSLLYRGRSWPSSTDDNRILECAVFGQPEAIITGDDDLPALSAYRGIRILSAAAFLMRLEDDSGR